jgi:LacI family repressor for deo operon, udp, cdd, tsx, nupC, and nupG
MSVTQKDIAEKLNISQAHVARALSGRGEVSAKTRSRIEAAAREMGYSAETNTAARTMVALRHGQHMRKGIIAIGLPPVEEASPRYLPYYIPLLNGLEAEAAQRGFDICLCPSRRDEVPRLIRERGVDGVISLGLVIPQIEIIQTLNIPILTIHEKIKGAHSLAVDDYDGACQLTRHLLELGHQRIAFLGAYDNPGSAIRLQAFRDTMQQHQIEVQPEWIEIDLWMPVATPETYCQGCNDEDGLPTCAACTGLQRLLAKNGGIDATGALPFTAIICHHDPTAMGVVENAQKLGIDVPGALSVTGFDDVSLQYHFRPALTSISFARRDMGRQALVLLDQAIQLKEKNESTNSYSHHIEPVNLIVRQTTAAPKTGASAHGVSATGAHLASTLEGAAASR